MLIGLCGICTLASPTMAQGVCAHNSATLASASGKCWDRGWRTETRSSNQQPLKREGRSRSVERADKGSSETEWPRASPSGVWERQSEGAGWRLVLKEKLTRARGMRTDSQIDSKEKTNPHVNLFLRLYSENAINSHPTCTVCYMKWSSLCCYCGVLPKERLVDTLCLCLKACKHLRDEDKYITVLAICIFDLSCLNSRSVLYPAKRDRPLFSYIDVKIDTCLVECCFCLK